MSIGGIGATVLGYQDPDVDRAVIGAISNGIASSLNCPEEVELAELLCELHPWADMARFSRCGGEALAIAVRIARAATGRDKVAFCGYHGWHDWYLAANLGTENALGEHLIAGLDPAGVPKGLAGTALPFSYNDVDGLEAIASQHGSDLAAIVMEPIRGQEPAPGFLDRVRALASQTGAVLVVDEVSAGFRLNGAGAHMVLGLEPDVAVFSKAIGNGYPIAAIIGRAGVMDAAQKSFISSTNWTERTGTVAALATIRKYQTHNVAEKLVATGEAVQAGWKAAAAHAGIDVHVGGIAPLSHFSMSVDDPLAAKAYFIQLMLDRGFLASTSFYAMFAHKESHVQAYLAACEEVFAMVASAIDDGSLAGKLEGAPSAAGFRRLA